MHVAACDIFLPEGDMRGDPNKIFLAFERMQLVSNPLKVGDGQYLGEIGDIGGVLGSPIL